jgi:hypothetical protein
VKPEAKKLLRVRHVFGDEPPDTLLAGGPLQPKELVHLRAQGGRREGRIGGGHEAEDARMRRRPELFAFAL